MNANIILLPGDGIGPEVVAQAVRVLQKLALQGKHTFSERLVGGCSIDRIGVPITDEILADCKAADAVLLGAVGGPKWDNNPPETKPEKALLALRKELALYANLRPVKVFKRLIYSSTLKPEILDGVDILMFRELTGGIYFGPPRGFEIRDGEEVGFNTLLYSESEVRRIATCAFEAARKRRKKVCSVDKANILETSQLWRKVVIKIASEYPDVELTHLLVDNCALQLIRNPKQFDVILTDNMFGDILSDEAAMLTGSIGMLPSASLGGKVALYEPIHGSAPDIAGENIANPIGTILSAAMMLRYSFHLEKEAIAVEQAVEKAIEQGYRTADLGGKIGTKEMGDAVIANIV
ncbi:MAG: 3-isopropylmalate dehydrogenase [Bacteroidota bacterium]